MELLPKAMIEAASGAVQVLRIRHTIAALTADLAGVICSTLAFLYLFAQ